MLRTDRSEWRSHERPEVRSRTPSLSGWGTAGTGRHFPHNRENSWEQLRMGNDTNRELIVEKGA
ncbi:MAG: hypothetical protein WC015_10185, partial [Methanoregula sp.]